MLRKPHATAIYLGILALNLAIIFFYWWTSGGSSVLSGLTGALIALGRLSGLLAAFGLLMQFLLIGRITWLEGIFGLDKLAYIHHLAGKYSIYLLILHPLAITWGYARAANVGIWAQTVDFILHYEHVWLAAIGLVALIAVVGSSIYIVRSRLRYEAWYFVHLLAYLAVLSSFWHQISIGTTLTSKTVFYAYWLGLYALVFGNYLAFRFLRPLYFYTRHRFTVSRVVSETHNTTSIYLTGRKLGSFPAKPGQFMFVRFLSRGRWWQAHPFSLSSVPSSTELRVTIKHVGDFTQTVNALQPGTRVFIDGPYGTFTTEAAEHTRVLCIAGGIGITPIRSLTEQLLQQGRDVVLLYANKTAEDIVFRQEFEALAQQYPGLRLVHILSREEVPGYEHGHVDQETLQKLVPDFAERAAYICGPASMIRATTGALKQLGMPKQQLHFEKFSLA